MASLLLFISITCTQPSGYSDYYPNGTSCDSTADCLVQQTQDILRINQCIFSELSSSYAVYSETALYQSINCEVN